MATLSPRTCTIKSSIGAGRYLLRLIQLTALWFVMLGFYVHSVHAKSLERELLTHAQLSVNTKFDLIQPISLKAMTVPEQSNPSKLRLQGHLTFSPITALSHLALVEQNDGYLFERKTRPEAFTSARAFLPEISIDFVQSEQNIIPVNRGLQASVHAHWDYIVGVGDIWQEIEDGDYSRISLPFALVEKNQNCVHNGTLSFLVNEQGKTTDFYYQISSETCLYYKANMWGKGQVTFAESNIDGGNTVVDEYRLQQKHRFPTQPLSHLKQQFSAINLDNITLNKSVNPLDISSVAVIFNGQHYVSDCMTRFGLYPFCSQMILPSYSTAKSIFAGLAMFVLEQEYPSIFQQKISDWVKECKDTRWQGVTFAHLLNMSTGNYQSTGHSVDEAAPHSQIFFKAKSHQEKINYSCGQFAHQKTPGSTFVYHTSDTYLLGSGLNNFLNAKLNKQQTTSVFEYVFVEKLWPFLQLSPVAFTTQKTADAEQQAFTGYGLFFTRDDIAKLAYFLMSQTSHQNEYLSSHRLQKTLQPRLTGDELETEIEAVGYTNGFWKRNITDYLGCENDTWLPFMSGYGGIAIVLAKPNMQYYYFSDSGQHNWLEAIKELNKITPLCR
jgi:hypothetical protein